MKTLYQNYRFWQPRPGEGKGECHGNPPLGLGWPLTIPGDWCRLGEAAEVEDPKKLESRQRFGKEKK